MSKIKDYAEQLYGEDWECKLEDEENNYVRL